MSIGYTLPFAISSGSVGLLDTTQDIFEAAKMNLKSLLLTNWGERPMHFYFGCNLIEFLFENRSDSEFKSMIADRIQSQVAKWLPYIRIDELNVILSSDSSDVPDHAIGIRIKFRIEGREGEPRILSQIVS